MSFRNIRKFELRVCLKKCSESFFHLNRSLSESESASIFDVSHILDCSTNFYCFHEWNKWVINFHVNFQGERVFVLHWPQWCEKINNKVSNLILSVFYYTLSYQSWATEILQNIFLSCQMKCDKIRNLGRLQSERTIRHNLCSTH